MKKRKILVLFPLLGLFLSGCTFQEALGNVKSWTAGHVLDPIKNLFNGGKKEEQSTGGDQKEDEGEKPAGEVTVSRITIDSYTKQVAVNYEYKTSDVSITVFYSDGTSEVKEPESVTCNTSQPGAVTLTVTYKGVSQTTLVTVLSEADIVHVESIHWDVSTKNLHPGESVQITVTFTPDNVTNKNLAFASSDGSVLTVSATGLVEAKAVGSATVKITPEDNPEKFKEITFTVSEAAASLPVSTSSGYQRLASGEKLVDGEKINVVGAIGETFYTMPEYTKGNNIQAKVTTLTSSGALDVAEGDEFTVVDNGDNTISLKQSNNKYLSAAGGSSNNYLKVVDEIDATAKFSYSVDESGYAQLQAEAVERGYLCLNPNAQNNNPLFGCYKAPDSYEKYAIYHSESGVVPTKVNITSANEVIVGGELTLSASVEPVNASQKVSWEISEGASFASLNGNVLKGLAVGSVVVKASSVGHESVFATATIQVKAPDKVLVESITASPASIQMAVGDEPVEIIPAILPTNYEEEVVWSLASGEGIISLADHKVSALAKGSGSVRIEGKESHVGVTVNVTVSAAQTPEPAKLNKTIAQIKECEPTKSQAYISSGTIKSWATSAGAESNTKTKYGNLIITDGENDIFVYGASGVATDLSWDGEKGEYKMSNSQAFLTNEITAPLQPGDKVDFWGTYYTFTKNDVTTYEMDIIITGKSAVAVESVSLDKNELNMEVGLPDETLVATVLPANASNKNVTWESSNSEVATVTDGLVHAVAAGDAVITAKSAADSSKTASCTVHVTQSQKQLVGIEVTKMPKVEYTEGEFLDLSGMEVTLHYDDKSSVVITSGWTTNIAPDHQLTSEDTSLVVSYGGFNATAIPLTINESQGIVQPGTYVISAVAESTTYYVKSNGTSGLPSPVTSMDDATQFDFELVENTDNQYYIKDGNSYLYTTAANNGLRVGSTQAVWTISEGSIENSEGFDICTTVTGNNGDETRYLSLYNTQDFRTYTSPTATNRKSNTALSVPVTSTLESISVTANPTKTSYLVGETFDPAGLEVTAHYELSNNTSKDVVLTADQYELSFSGAFAAGDVGEKAITVSFGGKEASFNVSVAEPSATLTSVTIEGTPKTNYTEGDPYSHEGLTATAHYSDNTTLDVTNSAQWAISKATAEYGDESITITASFGGESGQLPVNVSVEKAAEPQQVSYDFTNISDFSSWTNSYSAHTVEYDECTVSFEAASKQGSTITNMPVIKGGKYVNVVAKDNKEITAVTFSFAQWTTKTQTMTLYYSTDGGSSWTSTGVTVSDFSDLTSSSLPSGTNAVQIKGSNTSNQIGIAGVVVTYK